MLQLLILTADIVLKMLMTYFLQYLMQKAYFEIFEN